MKYHPILKYVILTICYLISINLCYSDIGNENTNTVNIYTLKQSTIIGDQKEL
jgi:hypothetical protein